MTLYPGASLAQWFGDTYEGVDMGGVDKVLLHTTETGTWPGYGGGASAPNLTYNPRTHEWRQHFHLERSARALRDPDGTVVRENRDRVCQVEIICSCDRSFANEHGYPHVTELDDQALKDLGDFIRHMHLRFGVPLKAAERWLPYPESYGNSSVRMSGAEYDSFRGVLGHQHASGNSHGDPGSLNVTKIMAYAAGGAEEDELNDAEKKQLEDIHRWLGSVDMAATPEGSWPMPISRAFTVFHRRFLANSEAVQADFARTLEAVAAVQAKLSNVDLSQVDETVRGELQEALADLEVVLRPVAQ